MRFFRFTPTTGVAVPSAPKAPAAPITTSVPTPKPAPQEIKEINDMADPTIPVAVSADTPAAVQVSVVTRDIKELLQGIEGVLSTLFQAGTTRDQKATELDSWIMGHVQAFVHEELSRESGALSAVEQTIYDTLKGKIEEVLHQYTLDLLEHLGF